MRSVVKGHEQYASASLTQGAILAIVILIGVLFRIAHYWTAGSFWHDEACLALNIVQRTFFELLRPLGYDQAAAVGYLWLEKGISLLFGSSERPLRLTSLLASVAVLVLLAQLCKRLFGTWCAIVAVALVSVSPLWIYYAAELKPYPLDAALALWVLLSFEALSRDQPPRAEWNRLFAKAALALLLSQSAVVILLPVSIALAFVAGGRYRIRALALLAMTMFIAATLYFTVYHAEAKGAFLKGYWKPYELSIWKPGLQTRLVDTAYNVFFRSLDSISRYLHTAGTALLTITGFIFAFLRTERLQSAVLASPFIGLLLASSAGGYPIAPRTILFALPLLVMLASLPIGLLGEWAASRHAGWDLGFGLLLVAFSLYSAQAARAQLAQSFPRISQQAVALYESSGNCDPIYVFASSVPVWQYYASRLRHSPFPPAEWMRHLTERNHERVFLAEGPLPAALRIQRDGCRPLIFGELAPQESQVLASYDWANAEMRRITSTGAHHIYVFGELFAPTALSSLAREAARCGGTQNLLFGARGRGYLGELSFPGGVVCP